MSSEDMINGPDLAPRLGGGSLALCVMSFIAEKNGFICQRKVNCMQRIIFLACVQKQFLIRKLPNPKLLTGFSPQMGQKGKDK